MFKIFFFAALVALAAAKPGVLAPTAFNAPLLSPYSAYPAVSAYSAHPAAYAAHPAAYAAHPAAYAAHPAAYSAYPYSAYPAAVSSYSTYNSPLLKSVVGAPVVGAYSAGVPFGYPGYY